MNLNDFFSKPTRIKEAYANNYPSYPAANAAATSSDDTDSTGEPKFDRLGKTGREASVDFRNGFTPGDDETDYETENEPELGTFRVGAPIQPDAEDTDAFMSAVDSYGEQNPYMQSWGGKYADQDTRIAPLRPGEFNVGGTTWRRVEDPAAASAKKEVQWIPSSQADSIASWKANNPGKSSADWGSIPAASKSSASGLPKMRFDRASQRLVPVDQPVALDLSPNVKNGANPNIDADTRARARAWAAAKNPGVDTVGNIEKRVAAKPTATSADGTAALPTPAAAPAVVKPVATAAPAVVKPAVVSPAAKPAEVPPAVTLKDLPAEKPGSWKDIAQANGIDNPNRIMPGQVLKIPGKADYVVQPGDTLADIAAGKIKAPKYTPTAGDTVPAATAVLKKYPNVGTLAPIPRDVMKDLGMDAQTKKEIAKNGREELLTPAIIQQQKKADADIAAYEKKQRDRAAAHAARKKTNEDDIDEDTMDDGFKWGSPTMPMQDGSVMNFNPQTNSYKQASPPTKPNLNTSMSTITRDRTTDKNGQSNQNYSDISIAMNPATGTGDYMHRQDVNGVPTTTFRKDVPADELAKLRAGAGIPPAQQAVKESLDRMRFLAGIRKK